MYLSWFQSAAALVLLIVPPTLAGPQNYYIDPSCSSFDGFDDTVAEAYDMARTTVSKMQANADVGMQRAFKMLFKDQNRSLVQGRLAAIGAFTADKKVDDPSQAAIIFSCDNDASWEQITDGDRKNQWKNTKYHMRYTGGSVSCLREDPALQHTNDNYVPAVGKDDKEHEDWMDEGWQEPRALITVCDRMKKSYTRFANLQKYEAKLLTKQADNSGNEVQLKIVNAPLTSRTLLHEMFHTTVGGEKLKDKYDGINGGKKVYFYQNVIKLAAADQVKFPDAFAFFGKMQEVPSHIHTNLYTAQLSSMKVYQLGSSDEEQQAGDVEKRPEALKRLRRFLAKCRSRLIGRSDPDCKAVL
ncbi:uncharacterized protein N0V89_008962 [Didymosphaeria variabile]|uniref:Lysine-specific metallo-endopeptidase domain-containing protein n=1 Tax=Didymosphaeria variabile TaxID=1932322 RepID=A0A9W8XJ69_9PLEO|nr:uncharacterized protein N0V89_008962 [Didymosphaeria variabile]KAJ4350341.1 hypothetical protein N0V89_008962 [Didymosphaeria variabile]